MNYSAKLEKNSEVFTFMLNYQPNEISLGVLTSIEIAKLAGIPATTKFNFFEIRKGLVRLKELPLVVDPDVSYTRRFLAQPGEKIFKYDFQYGVSHWGRPEINECELRSIHNVPDDKEIYEGIVTTTEEVSGNTILLNTTVQRIPIPRKSSFLLEGKNEIMLGYATGLT